jgi:PPOX class probable F420-dependent enzyme
MSVSEDSITGPGATTTPVRQRVRTGGGVAGAIAGLTGLVVLVAGVGASVSPTGVAAVPGPGSASAGLGVGLLLALIWRDALATVLAAAAVTLVLHAVHLGAALVAGGAGPDARVVGGFAVAVGLTVLVGLAFRLRLRRLGHVLGHVGATTDAALQPFVEQKTVVLDTFRRDGSAVPTAVSIAVDGDRAVVRTFEKAGKTRRLRRDPDVRIAPSTARGAPRGPAIRAGARLLDGPDAVAAARLLRRKYPVLHGVLVPLAHRVGRARTGRTVHVELVPAADRPTPAAGGRA